MAKLNREVFVANTDTAWTINVPRGVQIPVVAELVGGGGGGGGNDSAHGGNGAAGQYIKYYFTVTGGDRVSFIVGGGGGAGASGARAGGGGAAGTSVIEYPGTILDLRTAVGGAKNYAQTNSAWSTFMNEHAVWGSNPFSASYERSYDINFALTGNYNWKIQCDNSAVYYLDGVQVASVSGFTGVKDATVSVTKGVHTVRIVASNSGGPAGVALVINKNISVNSKDNFEGSMSGGEGGNAGGSGTSGAGGGGGGASVLILNGGIIAIAGGGGGGGGGGNGPVGSDATNTPDTSSGFYNGQDGQDKYGDGGGGGGSGGGIYAGAGGQERSGDNGGEAGRTAGAWGLESEWDPPEIHYGSGVTPYIPPGITDVNNYGKGGTYTNPGTKGYIRFTYQASFASYKLGNIWKDIVEIYVKDSGVWKPADSFIKVKDDWKTISRRDIVLYNAGTGVTGVDARSLAQRKPPQVSYDGGGWEAGFDFGFASGNEASGFSGDPGNAGPGDCCFIMLEARYGDGTMDAVVRRYRDEAMTVRNKRGYYKLAQVLVPLMRKSKLIKFIVAKTFADPLVCYGKWYYGENKYGWIFKPLHNMWMNVFDLLGTDTEFIRENGEVV